MDFSSNQKTKINNQLIKLRNQLFKKHLALSIPVVVCIALGLIVINLVNNTYNANLGRQLKLKQFPPQHILPDIIKLSFNNTVKHLHFLSEMILTLTEQNSNIYNGSMNLRYYKMFTAGGVCLLDQGSCQYRFAKLTNLIWYYQQSQQLNLMIDRVILCTKNGNTCAGTSPPNSDAITSQQLQFISDLSVNVSKPGQTSQLSIYNRLTDRIYMAVQISRSEMGHSDIDTVIIVKLENIKNIISSLDKKIQKSNIKQLQIVMGYPQAYQHRQTNQPSCLMCIYEKTSQSIEIFYDPQLPNKKTLFMLIEVKYSRYQDNMSYATGVSFFVCFLFVVFILRNQKQSISHWVRDNFYSKHLINQLYKYTIRDIFIGVKPNISNILQRGPSSELFRCLSELVDKSITPIYPEPEPNHYKQPFKFTSKITEIIENYKKSVEPLMQAKNRNILANRFNIQTFINDLCQSQARMIKQYYLRAQELRILKQFFNFAYMAVLRPVEEFLTFISQNQSPLPKKLLDFFIKMNENIHQVQKVRQKIESLQNDTKEQKQKEKKLSQSQRMHTTLSNFERVNTFQPQRVGSEHQGREEQPYLQQNKQQLQIRIRVHMIPKYLTILRDLDSRNNSLSIEDRRDSQKQESGCTYAQILHLDRELRSLGEIIQNTRYLLTKHNKTIRMFNK